MRHEFVRTVRRVLPGPGLTTAVAVALFVSSSNELVCQSPVGSASPAIQTFELKSRVFGNTRTVRVLLPPNYGEPAQREQRYPVFYFTDGRAAFDSAGWGIPAIVPALWRSGAIPDVIFVGIDNGGSTRESRNPLRDRASEYLPYPDQSWTDSLPPEPTGSLFPTFLLDEVMPLVNQRYRTLTDARSTGLAGSSYGGAVALFTAMEHPERFGAVLIQSPSLHIGDGALLEKATDARRWPGAIYLSAGTAEGATPAIQADMVANVRRLDATIRAAAPGTRVRLSIVDGGIHWFSAWTKLLPAALEFLLGTSVNR